MATASLDKMTLVLVYGGGWLVFATICASLVGARFADSVRPVTWEKLKRLAARSYALAALMFSGGFLCSLLVEISIGRSSQTSRAGGTLTVLESNSPLLFWVTIALKAATVIFAFCMSYKAWREPTFNR